MLQIHVLPLLQIAKCLQLVGNCQKIICPKVTCCLNSWLCLFWFGLCLKSLVLPPPAAVILHIQPLRFSMDPSHCHLNFGQVLVLLFPPDYSEYILVSPLVTALLDQHLDGYVVAWWQALQTFFLTLICRMVGWERVKKEYFGKVFFFVATSMEQRKSEIAIL